MDAPVTLFFSCFTTLLAIINPLEALPSFLKLLDGADDATHGRVARALMTIASLETPPRRFIAGSDAVGTAEQVAAELKAQTDAHRDLSTSLAFD